MGKHDGLEQRLQSVIERYKDHRETIACQLNHLSQTMPDTTDPNYDFLWGLTNLLTGHNYTFTFPESSTKKVIYTQLSYLSHLVNEQDEYAVSMFLLEATKELPAYTRELKYAEGMFFALGENYLQATQFFNNAIDCGPRDNTVQTLQLGLAETLALWGRPDAAKRVLASVPDPISPLRWHLAQAFVEYQLGNKDRALEIIEPELVQQGRFFEKGVYILAMKLYADRDAMDDAMGLVFDMHLERENIYSSFFSKLLQKQFNLKEPYFFEHSSSIGYGPRFLFHAADDDDWYTVDMTHLDINTQQYMNGPAKPMIFSMETKLIIPPSEPMHPVRKYVGMANAVQEVAAYHAARFRRSYPVLDDSMHIEEVVLQAAQQGLISLKNPVLKLPLRLFDFDTIASS